MLQLECIGLAHAAQIQPGRLALECQESREHCCGWPCRCTTVAHAVQTWARCHLDSFSADEAVATAVTDDVGVPPGLPVPPCAWSEAAQAALGFLCVWQIYVPHGEDAQTCHTVLCSAHGEVWSAVPVLATCWDLQCMVRQLHGGCSGFLLVVAAALRGCKPAALLAHTASGAAQLTP